MKNKEIEELLNKLKKCRDYDDEILLIERYGATLILSYIEQLEKDYKKEYKENYEKSEQIIDLKYQIKQLEKENDNINDTLAKIKDLNTMQYLNEKNFKYSLNEILKGDSDGNL